MLACMIPVIEPLPKWGCLVQHGLCQQEDYDWRKWNRDELGCPTMLVQHLQTNWSLGKETGGADKMQIPMESGIWNCFL